MSKKLKQTVSILVSLIMVFSVFAIVPFTASATPAATSSFVKVTDEPDDWSGDYLIVYEDGSKAFNGGADNLDSTDNDIDVTIDGGEIEFDDDTDAAKVTIAAIDGGYSIATANSYIGGLSANTNKIDIKSDAILTTISLDDDDYANIVSNSKYFRYNTSWNSGNGFRYFRSVQQKPVCLYKLTEASAPAPSTYTVTWKNYDGSVIGTSTVDAGETPAFSDEIGEIKAKPADNDYTYTFKGWDKEIVAATEDTTYTAVFDATAKYEAGYYIIGTMCGEKGWEFDPAYKLSVNTETASEYYYHGLALTANDAFKVIYAEPGKNFVWYPDNAPDFTVSEDSVYNVYFRPDYQGGNDWFYKCIYAEKAKYTVTWKNDDGSVIDTTTVAYGDTPTHADAAKEGNAQYTYTFAGWTPEIKAATADAEYTATFNSSVNEYTITWLNDDGSLIDTTTVAYGETPTHADATKELDEDYTYTFAGWDKEIKQVDGEATYTATFTAEERVYGKNGLVFEYGNVRFYKNDKIVYSKGLVQDAAGHYYYINSTGKAIKNCTYSFTTAKANGLMQGGTYRFDENGVMVIPRNGLAFENNGVIRYYENDQIVYSKGLVKSDAGDYYYINSSGKAVKNCLYAFSAAKSNGLMPAGKYWFDADGKLCLEA